MGERLALPLVGGIGHHPGALPGRDNAALTEPDLSPETCLKTRREASHYYSPGALPGVGCILIPVIVRDAVSGSFSYEAKLSILAM